MGQLILFELLLDRVLIILGKTLKKQPDLFPYMIKNILMPNLNSLRNPTGTPCTL